MHRYFTSTNSSIPYFEPSRPMPDSLTPPNGAISFEMMPTLMPTMPYSSAFGNAPDAADVAAVEVRGQAVFGVVGELEQFFFGLEAEQRRHRAEGFFVGDLHVGGDVGQHGRLEELCRPLRGACRRSATFAPLATASAMCSSTFSTACHVDQRALQHAVLEAVADFHLAATFSASIFANLS